MSVKISVKVCLSEDELRYFNWIMFHDNTMSLSSTTGAGTAVTSCSSGCCNCCYIGRKWLFGSMFTTEQRFKRMNSIRNNSDFYSSNTSSSHNDNNPVPMAMPNYHCHVQSSVMFPNQLDRTDTNNCVQYVGTKIRDKFSYNTRMYSDEIETWIGQHNDSGFSGC